MPRKQATQAVTATMQSTTTAQATTVKQSVEIMQTLIHSSVSSVLFARRMVPDECFSVQDYKPSDPHMTYDKFAKNTSQSLIKNPHARGVHVLKRGIRPRVDKLLDWLLAVSTDPGQLTNVVELYKFTFDYSQDALQNVTMAGPQGQKITVKNARIALRTMIQDLVMYCQTMPTLPPRGALRAYMTYTDNCPQKYEPPGFEPSSDNTVMLPGPKSNPDWRMDTLDLKSADVGFHSVSLQILNLSQILDDDTEEGQIPTDMIYDNPADRWSLVGVNARKPNELLNVTATQEGEVNEDDGNNSASSAQEARVNAQEHSKPTIEPLDRAYIESTPADDDNTVPTPSTRPEEDLGIRDRLRRMLPPSAEQTDTQPTQQQDLSTQTASHQHNNATQAPALQLSQTVVQQLEKVRSVVLPPYRASTMVRSRSEDRASVTDVDKINCQCNFNEEEDDMMQCCFCDMWQHLHCYGYLGTDDPRVPAVYACYQCLLEGKNDKVLRELRTITLFRRAIHLLEKRDISGDKELSTALHCGIQDTTKIRTQLQQQGFLAPSLGPKGGKGSRRLTLVRSKAIVSQMREEYFNPTRSIAHLVSDVISKEGSKANNKYKFELPPPSIFQSGLTQNASKEQTESNGKIVQKQKVAEKAARHTRTSFTPNPAQKRHFENAEEIRTPKAKRSRTQGVLSLELTPSPSSAAAS
ncbi:hypothetical protein P154DRAFT_564865 [Amniculicola lignicola CBS 123094]|uniref:HORMA domain-containing protein n=1 Tax=Amniculicola lignicola CBS 123094 TaxID=1392246 RepID=A0A6A5WBY4_9PLEO|nr:hypothetical protein P154DRAFT_564865 [Amniculicola lignicola CBS 123094]